MKKIEYFIYEAPKSIATLFWMAAIFLGFTLVFLISIIIVSIIGVNGFLFLTWFGGAYCIVYLVVDLNRP
jgi:hypothetical protein